MLDIIQNIDSAILLFIQDHIRCPALTWLMIAVSRFGDEGYGWIALGIILLFFKKTRAGGIGELAGLIGNHVACNMILKKLFMRTRPYLVIDALSILVDAETSTSFPSGHTASAFVCAYMLRRCLGRKFGIPAYIIAFLTLLSRMYVGVHYPTDVICGAVLGTVVGMGIYRLYSWILGKIAKKKAEN